MNERELWDPRRGIAAAMAETSPAIASQCERPRIKDDCIGDIFGGETLLQQPGLREAGCIADPLARQDEIASGDFL